VALQDEAVRFACLLFLASCSQLDCFDGGPLEESYRGAAAEARAQNERDADRGRARGLALTFDRGAIEGQVDGASAGAGEGYEEGYLQGHAAGWKRAEPDTSACSKGAIGGTTDGRAAGEADGEEAGYEEGYSDGTCTASRRSTHRELSQCRARGWDYCSGKCVRWPDVARVASS
jgi:hypothetical protein